MEGKNYVPEGGNLRNDNNNEEERVVDTRLVTSVVCVFEVSPTIITDVTLMLRSA